MNARSLYKAHLYLGLLVSLPLLVVILTGMILGFYDTLRYADPPYAIPIPAGTPSGPHLSVPEMVHRLETQYPNSVLNVFYIPTQDGRSARIKVTEAGVSRFLFLDPASGEVIAERGMEEGDWLDFIYRLHHGEPLGQTGKIIASAAGATAWVLWALGLVFHLRRRRAARRRPRPSGHLKPGSGAARLHRFVGPWLGLLVATWMVLGAILNYAGPLMKAFHPPPAQERAGPGTGAAAGEGRGNAVISSANAIDLARRAYPAAPLERIYFPQPRAGMWQLRFADGGRVYVAGGSGRVIRVDAPSSHWTGLLYPVHSGRLFGSYGTQAVGLLGVVALVLLISGLLRGLRRGDSAVAPVRAKSLSPDGSTTIHSNEQASG